jgi:LysM repeat protein
LHCSTNNKVMKRIWVLALSFAIASLQLDANVQTSKHVVKKGETLYSISKKYGLKLNDVLKANRGLSNSNIRIGQMLLIPNQEVALHNVSPLPRNYTPVYVPSTPDTPYRDEDMRERSGIPAITKNETVTESKSSAPAEKPIANVAAEYPSLFNQYATLGMKMKKNKGAANYLADVTSGNQNLAFYNEAEANTIVRVTNLMNHKTIFVKVIGKVPAMDAGNEISIKLSNKAAQELGAIDDKFLVEVASYFND